MITDAFDTSFNTSFKQIGFKIAWAVQDHATLQGKDDASYVTYQVIQKSSKGKVRKDVLIPFHKCTEEDWLGFYPPQP